MKTEIYFSDLRQEAQDKVLKHYEANDVYELNLDMFPLFVLEEDEIKKE